MKTIIDAYWADLFWSSEGRLRQRGLPFASSTSSLGMFSAPNSSIHSHTLAHPIMQSQQESMNPSSLQDQNLSARSNSVPSGMYDAGNLPSCLFGFPKPMHVLVADQAQRTHVKEIQFHVWTQHFPVNALVPLSDNYFVISPEFLLLEFARKMSLGELIALGHEFCGSYAIDARTGSSVFGLEPITSIQRLEEFAHCMEGAHGVKKLRRALPYIHEGSASPMETALAVRFCMPSRMGGYRLPHVKMNARIGLSDAARKVYKHNHCLCDLLFPEAQLDVEYNGKEFHLAKSDDDAARQGALDIMGLRQKMITAQQYRDFAAFGEIVRDIAKMHGNYMRRDQALPSKARILLYKQLEAYVSSENRRIIWE